MDILVTGIIAGVCLLFGFAFGFMSRNSRIDKLMADRDRANARADKHIEWWEMHRRSAEEDGGPRSAGDWSPPTGQPSERRTGAHGTVRPMPRPTNRAGGAEPGERDDWIDRLTTDLNTPDR